MLIDAENASPGHMDSADIELTITAMELLHERGVAGFCIVSSDSDFTPLVMKLREAGKLVIGFGVVRFRWYRWRSSCRLPPNPSEHTVA